MRAILEMSAIGRRTVVALLVLAIATGLAALVDPRMLNGVSVWAKPFKFAVSFALHLATLMVFLSLLRTEVRNGPVLRCAMTITCWMVVVELAYVVLQAARGRASHFNRETAWEAMAYNAMGAAVGIVMIGTLIVGLSVRRGARADVGPGLRMGVALGVVVGALATLATAGIMASLQFTPTGHWVGGDLSDASGLPLVGWSTTGGDLRVPHFFATHLIQIVPVIGWLADRYLARLQTVPVWLFTFAGLAVVWVTMDQAMAGKPLLTLFAGE